MPPIEILDKVDAEQLQKVIKDYKKFDTKWNIGKILAALFVGVSFIFGSGVGFQKGKDWVYSVDERISQLQIFTGYNKYHQDRMRYINSIKPKDGSGNDN